MKKMKLALAISALMLASTTLSYAACPADGATPFTIGPINPQNGFPQWIQDSNGATVEICSDANNCIFDPVHAGNVFSEQIGFGAEGFWWAADARLDSPTGLSALLVQAVEAAFFTENPVNGEQFPFSRLRIRVDTPEAGIYTITYPYGQSTFTVDRAGKGREINESFDIPLSANTPHQGRVGPFLTSTAAPAGFLGDSATETTVTGSPCGTNFFRIEAVGLDGTTPLNLDGAGGNVLQTDLFTVTGQRFAGAINSPLTIKRTTYSRTAAGQLDIFATSGIGATVTVSGGASLPAGELPLVSDGQGHFSTHIPISNAATLPATVNITSTVVNNAPTTLASPLVDDVTITQASYDLSSSTLTITASSSDKGTTPPTLTSANFGDLVNGTLTVNTPVANIPDSIMINSTAGGFDKEPVQFNTGGIAAAILNRFIQ